MTYVLGPDVYVNASVAPGESPEVVARNLLDQGGKRVKSSKWVLKQVANLLFALPEFKDDAVEVQISTIKELVDILEVEGEFGDDQWKEALVALAKAAEVNRVITDHPDLVDFDEPVDGIEFVTTDTWVVERSIPPPPPTAKKH